MLPVQGIIKPGYRVGSGTSEIDPRFNADGGTIRLQMPEFKKCGLDFEEYFVGKADEAFVCGTLGFNLAPMQVTILKPEYHFTGVRWTDKLDQPGLAAYVEDFYLSAARVEFLGKHYKALLYIPAPETKTIHFHPVTTLEVIAQTIPGIGYNDVAKLYYNPEAITVK